MIVLLGNFPFPTGTAGAARMRNLAIGLRECGAQVYVLAMAPPYLDPRAPLRTPLQYEHVAYEQTALLGLGRSDQKRTRVSTMIRQGRWLLGMYGSVFSTRRRLLDLIGKRQCDMVIAYGRNALLLEPMLQICRAHSVFTVLDVTEIPEQMDGAGGRFNPVYWDWRLGTQRTPRRFDLITTITYGLQSRYMDLGCQQVMVMPSIEGWDNLPSVTAPPDHGSFQLVYVGALIDRDSPDLLFESLRVLYQRGVPVSLDIIGRFHSTPEGRRRAELCRQDPMLRNCVRLVGEVGDDELKRRLREAHGLILMRRNAESEISSFPTRLVEYLKQGRPVFVSDVGDVGRYLRHQVDAMLLSPDDPLKVADAVEEIVSSPDCGYALGMRGQARGAVCFNRDIYARRLLEQAAQLAP